MFANSARASQSKPPNSKRPFTVNTRRPRSSKGLLPSNGAPHRKRNKELGPDPAIHPRKRFGSDGNDSEFGRRSRTAAMPITEASLP